MGIPATPDLVPQEAPKDVTTIHESRLAPTAEAYKAPENHLFRKAYRKLEPGEAALMDALKDKATELHGLISSRPKSRYISLSVTALEESIMWAVKDITA